MTLIDERPAAAEPEPEDERETGEPPPPPVPSTSTVVAPEGPDPRLPRQIRGSTLEQRFDLLGAIAGGISISTLLFGWFAPLTGFIGWVIVAYLAFAGLYVLLVRLRSTWQDVTDRIATVLLVSAGLTLFGTLVFVIAFTVIRGWDALPHLNFYVQDMRLAGPLDPLDMGGIGHAIVGTLIQIGIALAITIPLGLATAVFLNEVGGPFARFVRTITDAMTALPSIVAGLFIYATVVLAFQRSGFAAALAITVMMLPIVIRASDVVLRLVPQNLREASYALGTTRWRTVWHVVLPTSRSGLVTAIILGTARGIGETSPVLLTSGVTAALNTNPFEGPMISLPLQVFDFVKSPEPNMIARGFGTAAVLMLLVLLLFVIARIIGGRGPGQLSYRRQQALLAASRRDAVRMRRRALAESPAPQLIATTGYGGLGFNGSSAAPAPTPPPRRPRRMPKEKKH